ncbi:nitrite reductase/ring-hydroxylating ferredoxin subunit [Parabacteroides sp. PF5-5]|uniref:Rieske (2Fe-2S) protein n=1 Tax=unclassified Parabacteroides TaxID=2649774 RepID=UPI002472FE61|nr:MULTISPECIES: (2Fe-2S)-binding protein [unclassified Parabacteroides]MDH6305740.1 nitrite reductase/ring-hydroxylating ferredoxin subunit [Parabacteroides sp. PH5-39]MDH6316812.1 nitrite reductase/ring-hydroxylating ferredoxin subunit [Parabacteroides sp. PF5-13]MDH6320453.1 nitrite reductase/ring-hydroxylating ferredoxin subunit [Parabacteroides sp. PH5-13]MDH6324183.1 nitrite reductase/ring-hydroxylating ferredoxin subunit [Parabacteroides sp. PH5-8]MDH6327998.1 nitrite reductase/ring-hyd
MIYKRIFLCLLLALFASCDKTYISSIPDYPVYLELDLNFEDKDLVGLQSYKIYTSQNINQAVERAGFAGVLIYHGLSNTTAMETYYAFEIACPHEANKATVIEVDKDGIYAVCPKCESKFELLNGIGNPISGPANEDGYYLKSYKVSVSGNKIIVYN